LIISNKLPVLLLVTIIYPLYELTFAQGREQVRPLKMMVQRQYSGPDCTVGQLSLEGKIVGYTLERRWEGNLPLVSSIPAGTYHGFVKAKKADRWRIELTDVTGRENVQLHVGNFVADGVGCLLLGSNSEPDKCKVTDSRAAFDKFMIQFAAEAAQLGLKDTDARVELTIRE
jgi:hypothetical protein